MIGQLNFGNLITTPQPHSHEAVKNYGKHRCQRETAVKRLMYEPVYRENRGKQSKMVKCNSDKLDFECLLWQYPAIVIIVSWIVFML